MIFNFGTQITQMKRIFADFFAALCVIASGSEAIHTTLRVLPPFGGIKGAVALAMTKCAVIASGTNLTGFQNLSGLRAVISFQHFH